MSAIRAAVIGTGAIARQHLDCLARLPGVEVAAVCDISPAAAEAAAERHRVPAWFTDRAELLASVHPDVVHVTTPPPSHFDIASDAFDAGAAAIVEKPLTLDPDESARLVDLARSGGHVLVEDYSFLFQSQMIAARALLADGSLGEVTHVDVDYSLATEADEWRPGHEAPGAAAPVRGRARDALPHLASLAHAFAGPHRSVSVAVRASDGGAPDQLNVLLDGERATASIRFSTRSQPDGLWVRVHGTRMRVAANLFEPRMSVERLHGGPRPLNPLFNQLAEAGSASRAAVGGLVRKLGGGPGAYEGLWELVRRTYDAVRSGGEPPVSLDQIAEVNRLIADVSSAARAA